jgi:acyl-CoA synthetase (AMP-forming)/AMP-acid ligase II
VPWWQNNMSLKSFIFSLYSKWVVRREYSYQKNAVQLQFDLLQSLINKNKNTDFGLENEFNSIKNYQDFSGKLKLRNYEDFIPYIEKIKKGEKNILTSDQPLYLLMTSGTTAGTKYIPISKSGIQNQINAAMKLLCFHSYHQRNADFMGFKMIFLQGSPELSYEFTIPTGRLSGVVYHHVPRFFQRNKLPKYETNIITNWQEKVDKIVDETVQEDISILGGIPPWCIQYFEKLIVKSKKTNLKSLFPNLSIYIYGGLDFSSYREKIQNLLGAGVACLQTFPASEGFFGIQDLPDKDPKSSIGEMLLLVKQGVFYEFIPLAEVDKPLPKTIELSQINITEVYELIITNDSGLYRYRMGDLVQFTSIKPYRLKVVGRTSQFISAFGEHVIGYEIEKVMQAAILEFNLKVEDYHVCPNVEEKRYEWYIEMNEQLIRRGENNEKLIEFMDTKLSDINKYYAHLINGQIINSCQIIYLERGSFAKLRTKLGKEGGQNKVIRLANNRNFALQLIEN